MTQSGSDTAGVIARPPLLYAGFFLAGLGLDYIWPLETLRLLDAGPRYAVAVALFLIGGAFAGPAFLRFRAAGTSVPTYRPSTALVTSGSYRWSRNPIYIGLSLAYTAIAIAAAAAWSLILLVPLLAVMRYGVIAREEAYLERKFGDVYRRYTESVRRWL